ncbi:MAG: nucleotidyltransferase domain-containing protein [Gammaproteobacteria bacterium]
MPSTATATGSAVDKLLPKDYIMTGEGLYFAVVLPAAAGEPIHCSLRYVRRPGAAPQKLDTMQAHSLLKTRHPRYLGFSNRIGAEAVLVPPQAVEKVYRPGEVLAALAQSAGDDDIQRKAVRVIDYLIRNRIDRGVLGITGSLLLGFQKPDSDIDVVIYSAEAFSLSRRLIREALDGGEFTPLDEAMWRAAYARRGCALDFDTYVKHERRKFNKFTLDNTKVDISWVPVADRDEFRAPVQKLGPSTIEAVVVDDSRAFAYPARYVIENDEIEQILCYTATYTGQAFAGESIEAAGMIECDADGRRYMIIGTSREAPGEYIKVLHL